MLTLLNTENLPPERGRKLQLAAEALVPLMETLATAGQIPSWVCCGEPCPAPALSFIVPVYNAENFLFRCLDSLICQTLREIEIICVDDGSTDRSREILDFFSLLDARVKVIRHEKNSFAGAARNSGIAAARGEYLFFADPDDWCELTLAERAVRNGRQFNSDVITIPVRRVEAGSGRTLDVTNALANALAQKMPFSGNDLPEWILNIVSPAPWNKLFRRAFVAQNDLAFQEIHNNNDACFSSLSLAVAERISCIAKPALYHHRVGVSHGLQATKASFPLCVFQAYRKIKEELEKRGLGERLQNSYRKLILQNVVAYNFFELPPAGDGFDLFYRELRERFILENRLDRPVVGENREIRRLIPLIMRQEEPRRFLQEALVLYHKERMTPPGIPRKVGSFIRYYDEYGWRITWCHLFQKLFRKIAV